MSNFILKGAGVLYSRIRQSGPVGHRVPRSYANTEAGLTRLFRINSRFMVLIRRKKTQHSVVSQGAVGCGSSVANRPFASSSVEEEEEEEEEAGK